MTESPYIARLERRFIADREDVAIRLRINNRNRSESPIPNYVVVARSRNRDTWKVVENHFYDAILIKRYRWDCRTYSDAEKCTTMFTGTII